MEKPDLPVYEQVKAFIKGHISSGDWKPGRPGAQRVGADGSSSAWRA
jgi:hypothetical protein